MSFSSSIFSGKRNSFDPSGKRTTIDAIAAERYASRCVSGVSVVAVVELADDRDTGAVGRDEGDGPELAQVGHEVSRLRQLREVAHLDLAAEPDRHPLQAVHRGTEFPLLSSPNGARLNHRLWQACFKPHEEGNAEPSE